jgi:glycosyltransferase involved in cell wall biosynthesis
LRILCVSDEYPWPSTSGYRLRLSNILGALTELGPVDLFCAVGERPDLGAGSVAPTRGLARLYVHPVRAFRPTVPGMLRWMSSGQPRAVAWVDWRHGGRALEEWAVGRYDLVWFSHCHTWLALGAEDLGPSIVDFDNLEDRKTETLLALRGIQAAEAPTRSLRKRLRAGIGKRLDRVDISRWSRAQSAAAKAARAVVVCSELDRDRLDVPSAVVIPNGYETVRPATATVDACPSTLTMVGLMIYPPNLDGARFFAKQVMPLVRREAPEAVFQIVGRHDGELGDLEGAAGVVLTGEVSELDQAFVSTAVVVVPVRAGSGTRIKVLEAFARGLPVVATSIGCEGLGARHGIELLVADTPGELAAACLRLLREPELAASIAAGGHRLWERRYRWEAVRALVASTVLEVAAR